MEGGTNDDMIQKRFGLDIPVFVILQEKLEDILSKAPDWWGTSDKDIYDNLIFVMSPATAEIIAEKIGEPTKELEQICICDNTIFGLSTGINIVDLVNPEKLFFIGNRNFEFVRPITGRRRIMAITLKKATREDIETIWKMQVEAFTELLDKYQDFDMSPATESLEKIIAKFEQPWTTYYYIVENDIVVGAVRIVNKNDGSRKRISPIWIMGEFRNKGYAQQAMIELENIYGSDHWCLDTILQEKGNLHLYEKMGYVQTGKVEHINEKLDIVFYEKN